MFIYTIILGLGAMKGRHQSNYRKNEFIILKPSPAVLNAVKNLAFGPGRAP
jgi:hypothetical protein